MASKAGVNPLTSWPEPRLRHAGWAIWVLWLAAQLIALVVTGIAPPSAAESDWGSPGFLADLAFTLMAFSFPCVGLLIVHRQPANRFGWLLLLGVGTAIGLSNLLDSYAVYGLTVSPGALPGAAVAAALNEGSWVWMIGAVGIFVILLYPDGRLPSPPWRWLARLAGIVIFLITVAITLGPGELTEGPVPGIVNPIGVASWEKPLLWLLLVTLPLLPACIVASAVALVRRFRRSRGVERLQLKWLSAAGALVAVFYLLAMAGLFLQPGPFLGGQAAPTWLILLQELAISSFGLIPVAIAMALLRYRLYDIDRVINRTVVYGVLTTMLVTTYLVSVLVLRVALDPLAGQSDLAVAASTLAVAGAFGPLRSRVQRVVDRHFFRSRYDAARTVEAFSGRLRQEVDLEAVSTDLSAVVRETMQPAHVSLWLRGTP